VPPRAELPEGASAIYQTVSLRTWVNKGKKEGRSTIAPALDDSLLGDPSYMPRVSATSFEKSV
jgi:hypothetical protein